MKRCSFDTDEVHRLKPTAAATLDEIVASIGQLFANKNVRVMGFADSRGDASYNLQLGQDADAVKKYLVENGKLPEDKVSHRKLWRAKPVSNQAKPLLAGRPTDGSKLPLGSGSFKNCW